MILVVGGFHLWYINCGEVMVCGYLVCILCYVSVDVSASLKLGCHYVAVIRELCTNTSTGIIQDH
jgi:hypothetical protein